MSKIFFPEASFIRLGPSLGAGVVRTAGGGTFDDLPANREYHEAEGHTWIKLADGNWTAESNIIDLWSPDNAGLTDLVASLLYILRWEGGYVNDPRDPGGETKYGISKRSYPNLDISNLTFQEALRIYERDYWKRSGADELPWPTNLIHFNFAVNAGLAAAESLFERIAEDSLYGQDFIASLLIKQEEYYRSLNQFDLYGRGWLNRLHGILKYTEEIASYGLHSNS